MKESSDIEAFRKHRDLALMLLKAAVWDAALLVPEKELKALLDEYANGAYMALSS